MSRLQHDLDHAVTLLQAAVNVLGQVKNPSRGEWLHLFDITNACDQTQAMSRRYADGSATYLEAEAWLEATHDLLTTLPKGN